MLLYSKPAWHVMLSVLPSLLNVWVLLSSSDIFGAVVGAQVTAKSFPITENLGSNPVIVNFYRKFIYSLNKSAKMKRKRREILYDQHFFQNIRFLWPLGNKSGSTYQRSRCSRPYTFRHFLPSRILRVGDFIEADEDEVSECEAELGHDDHARSLVDRADVF